MKKKIIRKKGINSVASDINIDIEHEIFNTNSQVFLKILVFFH